MEGALVGQGEVSVGGSVTSQGEGGFCEQFVMGLSLCEEEQTEVGKGMLSFHPCSVLWRDRDPRFVSESTPLNTGPLNDSQLQFCPLRLFVFAFFFYLFYNSFTAYKERFTFNSSVKMWANVRSCGHAPLLPAAHPFPLLQQVRRGVLWRCVPWHRRD